MESTLSLLSVKHDQSHLVSQKILDPIFSCIGGYQSGVVQKVDGKEIRNVFLPFFACCIALKNSCCLQYQEF